MNVDVKNISEEQMKDKLMEIKIENLKKVEFEKQYDDKYRNVIVHISR